MDEAQAPRRVGRAQPAADQVLERYDRRRARVRDVQLQIGDGCREPHG